MKQGNVEKVLHPILVVWFTSVGFMTNAKGVTAGVNPDKEMFSFSQAIGRPISFILLPDPIVWGRSASLPTNDSCRLRAIDGRLPGALGEAYEAAICSRLQLEQGGKGQKPIFTSLEEAVAGSSKPQLLIFFSLACHVCWEELFEMKEFIETYTIPVGIVGIAHEPPAELASFAARYSFPYPIVHDGTRQLFRQFRVKLEPFRVILEKGTILYRDDLDVDYFERRDRVKRCLLEIASK